MTKLKRHKGLVLLVVLLLAVGGYLWFFHGTRPLLRDETASVDIAEWKYHSGDPDDVDLMAAPDFDAKALTDILEDARISRTGSRAKQFSVEADEQFFSFFYWVDGGVYIIQLGEKHSVVLLSAESRYVWEIENHDEIYTRLMDLFGDKLPV